MIRDVDPAAPQTRVVRFGIDYAFSRPSVAAMKTAGVTFACRYVSTPGNPKNLTKAEATKLRAAGIDVVTNFEVWGFSRPQDVASLGHAQGVRDAESGASQHAACGGPPRAPIVFSVDTDVQGLGKIPQALDYAAGLASVLGKSRVGLYGGYGLIRAMFDADACKYGWQTLAWSYGHVDPRVQIFQYSVTGVIGGAQVDLDHALYADFGQWDPPKPPQPKPLPDAHRMAVLREWILARHAEGWTWPRIKQTHNWKEYKRGGGR